MDEWVNTGGRPNRAATCDHGIATCSGNSAGDGTSASPLYNILDYHVCDIY